MHSFTSSSFTLLYFMQSYHWSYFWRFWKIYIVNDFPPKNTTHCAACHQVRVWGRSWRGSVRLPVNWISRANFLLIPSVAERVAVLSGTGPADQHRKQATSVAFRSSFFGFTHHFLPSWLNGEALSDFLRWPPVFALESAPSTAWLWIFLRREWEDSDWRSWCRSVTGVGQVSFSPIQSPTSASCLRLLHVRLHTFTFSVSMLPGSLWGIFRWPTVSHLFSLSVS